MPQTKGKEKYKEQRKSKQFNWQVQVISVRDDLAKFDVTHQVAFKYTMTVQLKKWTDKSQQTTKHGPEGKSDITIELTSEVMLNGT